MWSKRVEQNSKRMKTKMVWTPTETTRQYTSKKGIEGSKTGSEKAKRRTEIHVVKISRKRFKKRWQWWW